MDATDLAVQAGLPAAETSMQSNNLMSGSLADAIRRRRPRRPIDAFATCSIGSAEAVTVPGLDSLRCVVSPLAKTAVTPSLQDKARVGERAPLPPPSYAIVVSMTDLGRPGCQRTTLPSPPTATPL